MRGLDGRDGPQAVLGCNLSKATTERLRELAACVDPTAPTGTMTRKELVDLIQRHRYAYAARGMYDPRAPRWRD